LDIFIPKIVPIFKSAEKTQEIAQSGVGNEASNRERRKGFVGCELSSAYRDTTVMCWPGLKP
jgi:hypothetical protein